MKTHSKYSPSKLAILEQCPSFVSDGQVSEIAQRGIDIGDAIANALMGLEVPEEAYSSDAFHYGMRIIQDVIKQSGIEDWIITPERRLDVVPPSIWGYADIVITSDDDKSIAYLFEIKTGYGNREPADNNIQIQAYTLGLLNEGYKNVYAYLIELDRRYNTSHIYSIIDEPLIKERIFQIISQPEGLSFRSGNYCNYCLRLIKCPEFIESLPDVVATVDTTLDPKSYAKSLSPQELSILLSRLLPLFSKAEKYINELKARAMALIESGINIPNWMVKTTNGNRQWTDEIEAIWRITDIAPHANIMQLKSVAQVEKELKQAGIKKRDIDALLYDLTIRSEKKQLTEV